MTENRFQGEESPWQQGEAAGNSQLVANRSSLLRASWAGQWAGWGRPCKNQRGK